MSKRKVVIYVPDEQLIEEKITYTDHLGIIYESKQAMCNAWGQSTVDYAPGYKRSNSVLYGLMCSKLGIHSVYTKENIEELTVTARLSDASIKDVYKRIQEGWCPSSACVVPSDSTKKTDYLMMLSPAERNKWKSWSVLIKQSKTVLPKIAKKRLDAHWEIEDAITRPADYNYTNAVYDTEGMLYHNLTTLLQAKGITEQHYTECMERGLDREMCLKGVYLMTPSTKKYNTISDLCADYGIDYETHIQRLLKERTKLLCNVYLVMDKLKKYVSANIQGSNVLADEPKEEAHTTRKTTNDDRTDHKGITYNTVKAMCKAYDTSPSIYYQRKNRGMSMEGRLTGVEPTDVKEPTVEIKETSTNIVNKVSNLEEEQSNITNSIGNIKESSINIKNKSNDIEEIKSNIENSASKPELHTPSLDDIVKELLSSRKAITKEIYKYRIEQGMTPIEACLVLPYHYGKENAIIDFAGNRFAHRYEMCEYYCITENLYEARLEDGLSQADALCTPFPHWDMVKELGMPTPSFKDHRGVAHESLAELCWKYNMPVDEYQKRLRMGYPKALLLTLPLHEHYQDDKSILKILDRGTRYAN